MGRLGRDSYVTSFMGVKAVDPPPIISRSAQVCNSSGEQAWNPLRRAVLCAQPQGDRICEPWAFLPGRTSWHLAGHQPCGRSSLGVAEGCIHLNPQVPVASLFWVHLACRKGAHDKDREPWPEIKMQKSQQSHLENHLKNLNHVYMPLC